ncbi:MAG: hypothetical protein ACQKBT_02740, partial [Puniceicoccales bacterium]
TRQIVAGKNLMSGYQLYSLENKGRLIPGLNRSLSSVDLPHRTVSFAEAPHRYPWRLLPYLGDSLDDTIFVNGNREQIIENFGSSGGMYDYGVSIWPSFGMNFFFVGGTIDQSGNLMIEQRDEVITRQSESDQRIIVFATAGSTPNEDMNFDGDILGYHEVQAPYQWTADEWSSDSKAQDHGYVSARFDDKAVCAFLDGSVEALEIEELRDMRLWSRNAALANNPDYVPE